MKKIMAQLLKALQEEGCDKYLPIREPVAIDISDELYKQNSIKIILPRQEIALVHEADAYARSTGKVGVCLLPADRAQRIWSPALPPLIMTVFRLFALM